MSDFLISELSLILLIGPSSSGKTTFSKKHFKSTEVISSDFCRGLVSDNENDQSATDAAFEVLHLITQKRLEAGRLTIIDATNIEKFAREALIKIAKKNHVLPVAIVFNLSQELCEERHITRKDRTFGVNVIHHQFLDLKRSLKQIKREGFSKIGILNTVEEVNSINIVKTKVWSDKRHLKGPFDILGDLHGCFDETESLLKSLDYQFDEVKNCYYHPSRTAIFLGDLVDRGPENLKALNLVMSMVKNNFALCMPGNHDMKFLKYLKGKKVKISHGLEKTVAEFESLPPQNQLVIKQDIVEFLDGLVSHAVLDEGKLIVAHAGMKEKYQMRASKRIREFALYGETTGEVDQFGLPVRYNWASEYKGEGLMVYGHTPVPEAEWLNNTICLDTGCVFGGKLTALRYPEKELKEIPASKMYYEPIKPLLPVDESPHSEPFEPMLNIEDVLGKRFITTQIYKTIKIHADQASAALETMSRYAIHPNWLIHLPATMSPAASSQMEGYLEHPKETFAYYKKHGINQVICQTKHMGSRAMIIVCKNSDVTKNRFGIESSLSGVIYSRSGRRFFDEIECEEYVLNGLRRVLGKVQFWEQFSTEWVLLDCEILPWSLKAENLIKELYAALNCASKITNSHKIEVLKQFRNRGLISNQLLEKFEANEGLTQLFQNAFHQYCKVVESPEDILIAPFHILACENQNLTNNNHLWHMNTIQKWVDIDPTLILKTPYKELCLSDKIQEESIIKWWENLTQEGCEGMVVKPLEFIAYNGKGQLIQPALKCRGREYLRLIYGPEYTLDKQLKRLKSRNVSRKRALALQEFSLGIEAISRFVNKESLRRVHECVFGVMALESEPVDPRL